MRLHQWHAGPLPTRDRLPGRTRAGTHDPDPNQSQLPLGAGVGREARLVVPYEGVFTELQKRHDKRGLLVIIERGAVDLVQHPRLHLGNNRDPNFNRYIREPGHVEYASKLGLGIFDSGAISLREIEGLATAEVAVILGSSEVTVRGQVSKAMARLRALMNKERG